MTTSYILKRQAELRKNKALMRAAERAGIRRWLPRRIIGLQQASRMRQGLRQKFARIKQGGSSAGFCGN
jgi:hypothetical protein